ncbi:hypothetical protein GNZ12_34355 [Paraburkholderia sp. 1N]|uniref:Secreted protein n=1 Tax=Paraburkholderia solitsugae TaxID=2675748 RepID=A0ABX2C1U8_9BURK|nr:hypothetical protein [Paraburkholderia solitsugae]NPT46321.1 hypothetical protein [Paraburkholderia solitsugae]
MAGFALPGGLAQAVSLAAAVVRDPAASIAHVAIWRIFIVLFFPDSLLLSAAGAEYRIVAIHHKIVKKRDCNRFAAAKALKLQRNVIRREQP